MPFSKAKPDPKLKSTVESGHFCSGFRLPSQWQEIMLRFWAWFSFRERHFLDFSDFLDFLDFKIPT